MEEFDPGDEGYWNMEDFENYSKSYKCNGKLGRIWRNGVNLGKKMVITGVVVSSAPFILPPLVALSAIGVAFSVPAGFVFATYACGEKLMNALLPMPSSTPYEENGSMYCDEEEYRIYGDGVDKGYEEDDDLEVEEQKLGADIRKGLEMRIELVEENNKQFDDYDGTTVDKDELDKRSSKASAIVEEGYGEDDCAVEEEQPVDSKACYEILEGFTEAEIGISLIQKQEGLVPRVSEIVEEGYEEAVTEYMADEEQPLDEKAIPEILEGIKEAENEISSMEKEEGGMPSDSLRSAVVVAQLGGENEIDVEQAMEDTVMVPPIDMKEENELAGIEEDKLRIERKKLIEAMSDEVEDDQKSSVKETPKENGKSGIAPVKNLYDKGNKNFTISEEVEPVMDDRGVKTGLKSENNVEQVTEGMAFVPTRDINKTDGFSGIEQEELSSETTGLIEKMRDEGKDDQERKDSPKEETPEGNEEFEIVSVKDMSREKGNENVTIPKLSEPTTDDKGVMNDLEGENSIVQVTEDMAAKEEELQSESTRFNEKMRDVGNDNQKSKDSATKETPEEIVESGGLSIKDMSQDKGNTNLSVISKGVEPALNDKGMIFDFNRETNLENTSIRRDEPESAVENQVVVNVKIDGVTEVHRGTGSDMLGNLILSNEDTWEMTVESGFDLSDNGSVIPHQIVDSSNKIEGEGHHLNNMVEVTVDHHKVVIESAMPVSEHAGTAKDQGTTAGYKVKQEEEKLWEQINAMRTIVGYTNTPHLTCAEELKALFDFTGVELPTSSDNPADLVDINEKLHFLMSIIGVK